MKFKLQKYNWGGRYGEEIIHLQCPKCGEDYVHHDNVSVFNREEDGLSLTTIVDIHGFVSQSMQHPERNPSARRDGVAIHLTCENCNLDAELCILQHKGFTVLELRECK